MLAKVKCLVPFFFSFSIGIKLCSSMQETIDNDTESIWSPIQLDIKSKCILKLPSKSLWTAQRICRAHNPLLNFTRNCSLFIYYLLYVYEKEREGGGVMIRTEIYRFNIVLVWLKKSNFVLVWWRQSRIGNFIFLPWDFSNECWTTNSMMATNVSQNLWWHFHYFWQGDRSQNFL